MRFPPTISLKLLVFNWAVKTFATQSRVAVSMPKMRHSPRCSLIEGEGDRDPSGSFACRSRTWRGASETPERRTHLR